MNRAYIAISGNTGAGKSTLVKRLGVLFKERGYKVKAFEIVTPFGHMYD